MLLFCVFSQQKELNPTLPSLTRALDHSWRLGLYYLILKGFMSTYYQMGYRKKSSVISINYCSSFIGLPMCQPQAICTPYSSLARRSYWKLLKFVTKSLMTDMKSNEYKCTIFCNSNLIFLSGLENLLVLCLDYFLVRFESIVYIGYTVILQCAWKLFPWPPRNRRIAGV